MKGVRGGEHDGHDGTGRWPGGARRIELVGQRDLEPISDLEQRIDMGAAMPPPPTVATRWWRLIPDLR
jgi:hypothetical protein